MRYCKHCHSPRHDPKCHKCGGPTVIPHKDWSFPDLPNVNRIRELAKQVGYAIGEHGTKERDLDVIAAPWTDKAVSAEDLLQWIAAGMNGRVIARENKPLGRLGANIQIDGYFKLIDISVCPMAAA